MTMFHKPCVFCAKPTWHNPTTKKYTQNEGEWRCTRCGYPPSTNPMKREAADRFMRRIAGRI